MASLRFIPSLIPVYNQTLNITYGLVLPAGDVDTEEYINTNRLITISVFDPFTTLVSLQEHIVTHTYCSREASLSTCVTKEIGLLLNIINVVGTCSLTS